jgi:hypothetical protein
LWPCDSHLPRLGDDLAAVLRDHQAKKRAIQLRTALLGCCRLDFTLGNEKHGIYRLAMAEIHSHMCRRIRLELLAGIHWAEMTGAALSKP